jgi:hypothetical protein
MFHGHKGIMSGTAQRARGRKWGGVRDFSAPGSVLQLRSAIIFQRFWIELYTCMQNNYRRIQTGPRLNLIEFVVVPFVRNS